MNDQRRDDVLAIMSTASGRRYVWRLLSVSHVFAQTFTGEAMSGAFNEGARSIGLAAFAEVMALCPEHYALMQREAVDDAKRAMDEADQDVRE